MPDKLRTALVTGGAAGLGQAYAQRLARDGLAVVIADVASASDTIDSIRRSGGEAVSISCDVTDPRSIDSLAREAAAYGHIDVLIHNAGVYPLTPFSEISLDEWRYVMSIHLDALFHLCRAFLPGMREQRWGRIVAISSDVCMASIPGLSHYTAAKAGVIGFVRGLASEIGEDGVTINAVAPGLVRTPGSLAGGREELGMFESYVARQAIKRTPTPDDVSGAVSFLVSDDAALITGQTLLVDGGWAFN